MPMLRVCIFVRKICLMSHDRSVGKIDYRMWNTISMLMENICAADSCKDRKGIFVGKRACWLLLASSIMALKNNSISPEMQASIVNETTGVGAHFYNSLELYSPFYNNCQQSNAMVFILGIFPCKWCFKRLFPFLECLKQMANIIRYIEFWWQSAVRLVRKATQPQKEVWGFPFQVTELINLIVSSLS